MSINALSDRPFCATLTVTVPSRSKCKIISHGAGSTSPRSACDNVARGPLSKGGRRGGGKKQEYSPMNQKASWKVYRRRVRSRPNSVSSNQPGSQQPERRATAIPLSVDPRRFGQHTCDIRTVASTPPLRHHTHNQRIKKRESPNDPTVAVTGAECHGVRKCSTSRYNTPCT